jgi:DNA-binding NarL/FixJ family response regulator
MPIVDRKFSADTRHQFRDQTALTPRERELIEAYGTHGSYEGVCKALGLKRASISDRFGLIRSKLGVASNEAAVLAAKGDR